jgi:membrane-bound lytic murein transglycosylase D
MKKLSLFVIPLGVMCSGITLTPTHPSEPQVDLRHLAGQMTSLQLEAPADLSFAGIPVPLELPYVKQKLDQELKRHQYYYTGNLLIHKRAARYRETFQRILREYQVPEDFFYLAIAESNLSNATSPVGAKGFWQFMKPTARAYGLEVSASVDERYHPEKAAHAAAHYFLDAFERFGDWTLVAASYNMGQYGLHRQVRNQDECNYYNLRLNQETSQYMYRILTYKVILEQPQRFGLRISNAELYAPITYRSVWVSRSIPNLKTFAREHGTTYRRLKQLNPWLVASRLEVKPGKSYEIRIPVTREYIAAELEVDHYQIDMPAVEFPEGDSILQPMQMVDDLDVDSLEVVPELELLVNDQV